MLAIPTAARTRRFTQLLIGLVLFGGGLALMVRARLGLGPWDVLHQGLSEHTGVPIGTVGIGVGALVMLGWIPLRLRAGIGTIVNTVLVGLVIDGTMLVVDDIEKLGARWTALLVGLVVAAAGTALYMGAGLGTGPRDGLMTGLSERTGLSLRAVRTAIEVSALTGGWLLGGQVGAGTVLFAFAIGPLLQYGLGRVTVPASPPIE